jgi:acetoacetate decarboxylase
MTFAADTPIALPLSEPATPDGPVRFIDRGGLFGPPRQERGLTFQRRGA